MLWFEPWRNMAWMLRSVKTFSCRDNFGPVDDGRWFFTSRAFSNLPPLFVRTSKRRGIKIRRALSLILVVTHLFPIFFTSLVCQTHYFAHSKHWLLVLKSFWKMITFKIGCKNGCSRAKIGLHVSLFTGFNFIYQAINLNLSRSTQCLKIHNYLTPSLCPFFV